MYKVESFSWGTLPWVLQMQHPTTYPVQMGNMFTTFSVLQSLPSFLVSFASSQVFWWFTNMLTVGLLKQAIK